MGLVILGVFAAALVLQPKPATKVVLLPNEEGVVGRVIVTSTAGTQEISSAYGALAVGKSGQLSTYQESAESVNARHSDLLAARPSVAKSYLLYFKAGGSELMPESLVTIDELKRDAEQRAAPEISVIGHTDTVGSEADNDALSLKRAELVADQLVKLGIRSVSFESIGRGERALLVQTADGVDEAQNRRVEVSIR